MGHVMCPVTLPLVVAGDGGGCLKLRALAGRSLSVFLSLSIQAVAYLPVEYSSGARNGDRYGKEAENVQRTWLCELFCFALLFFRSAPQNFPPKKILSRRNIASFDSAGIIISYLALFPSRRLDGTKRSGGRDKTMTLDDAG